MSKLFTVITFLLFQVIMSRQARANTLLCESIFSTEVQRPNYFNLRQLSVSEIEKIVGSIDKENLAQFFRNSKMIPTYPSNETSPGFIGEKAFESVVMVVFSLGETYRKNPHQFPFLSEYVKLDGFLNTLFEYYRESIPASTIQKANKKQFSEDLMKAKSSIERTWAILFHFFRRQYSLTQLEKKEVGWETLAEVADLNSSTQLYSMQNGKLVPNFGWRHELSSASLAGIIKNQALLSSTDQLKLGLSARFGESQISDSRIGFDEVWVSKEAVESFAMFAWIGWFDQFPVTLSISKTLAARPSFIRSGNAHLSTFREDLLRSDQWVVNSPVQLDKIDFVFADRAFLNDPVLQALPKNMRRVSYEAAEFISNQTNRVNHIVRKGGVSPQEALRRLLIQNNQ